MSETIIHVSGMAEVLDTEMLSQYIENLSVKEADSLCERFLELRRPMITPRSKDAVEDAINKFFHVPALFVGGHDLRYNRWSEKQAEDVDAYQKFFGYCREYGQTPKVGFWAEGAFAYLYQDNKEKGIVIPEPEKFLRYIPDQDYSGLTPVQLRQQLGLEGQTDSLQSLVPAEAEDLTGGMLSERLEEQNRHIHSLEQELDDVMHARCGELAELRVEMERIKAELDKKKDALMAELNRKKEELEAQKEVMENQIWLLDSQIYAIRCFAGEVVQFAKIRSGQNAPVTEPVVIYQKLRFLDEELGRLASLYEIEWEEIDLFEQFLKHSPLALDTFAPNERCVVLVRLSRTATQQGVSNVYPYSNMFKQYEYFHGRTVGIIIRNGENVYLGWTEEDRVHIQDDLLISKVVTEVSPADEPKFVFDSERKRYEEKQKLERKRFLDGVISRSFVYNILQGVVEHSNMLPLPDGVTLAKPSSYVVYSVADKWLVDNRFGSFNDIVEQANKQVSEGDMLLTVQRLVPERSTWGGHYSPRWNNVRGRGDRNRTHDCSVSDCTIYKANLVEYDDPVTMLRYRYNGNVHTINKRRSNLGEDCEIIEEYEDRPRHVFVSVPKQWSYAGARSNFELNSYEYINLTYLNSVWLEWAVTTRNLGGWTVGGEKVSYAYAIKYLKTALEFVRKREEDERVLLDAVDPSICQNPDWPLKLSQWKLDSGVRAITPYQAKRFAKKMAQAAKSNDTP